MNDCTLPINSNDPSDDPDAMNDRERNQSNPGRVTESGSGSKSRFTQKEIRYKRLGLRVNDCTLASQSNYPSEDLGSMNEN